ncbi:AMP-binding protein [Photobacterium swingsii]|uniref:AMP-binding protein n=1 Tax=Photobacterium swingsii TaxID=680026 RepID=UPI00406821C8
MAEAGIVAFNQVKSNEHMVIITHNRDHIYYSRVQVFCILLVLQIDKEGAILAQAKIVCNAMVTANLLTGRGNDIHLTALPLFYSFGQTVYMNTVILCGATLLMIPRFEPRLVMVQIEQHKATIFSGVPAMSIGLL